MPKQAKQVIKYRRPPLTKYQLDAFFHDKRYGWTEGTVKCGKTHGLMAWFFEKALFGKNINHWWTAPVYPQAKIAYTRLKNAIPVDLRKANDTDLTLTTPNNRILWFKSGEKPDNLYGEDVGTVAIDEGPRMREESWHALRSTVTATHGLIRGIGNVKGRSNWFYKLCRKAEAGDPNMHYSKITAMDAVAAGILDQIEIDDARANLPEQVFNELYLAIPSEDGGNPFGLQHIAACLAPLSGRQPVCIGIDLAKSVDYTVIIGLDMFGKVCRFERFQMPWLETKRRIREIVGDTKALVDSTGLGDPVLEDLQRSDGDVRPNFEGYKFTQESKQKLMEGLTTGIQQHKIGYPDGPIRLELEAFEYEYTRIGVRYTAPEGMHDDCVCALALAYQKFASMENRGVVSAWPQAESKAPTSPSWAR